MAIDTNHQDLSEQAISRFAAVKKSKLPRPNAEASIAIGRLGREFCIYSANLGFELQEELDFLSNRVLEPNVFFTARLLVPAMPRIDDKSVHFAVMRDEGGNRSRMRFLMPFTVEKPGLSVGPSIMRAWSNPFGPVGTPLVDEENAHETIDNLLEALSNPAVKLPDILVLPEIKINGPVASLLKVVAINRNLPYSISDEHNRIILQPNENSDDYVRSVMAPRHYRDIQRLGRKLEKLGTLQYHVARQPAEIRERTEEFLNLEAKGWKGRNRTALVNDRYRAAFAREAIANLAEIDGVRIHTINLNGKAIASMIVFISKGEAYTWKTAYDEDYAQYSPGQLLLEKLTQWQLDDFNINKTDSCADSTHPLMSKFWKQNQKMGTLIIGLKPNSDRDVRNVAMQSHLYRNTKNLAKMLRDKVKSLLPKA